MKIRSLLCITTLLAPSFALSAQPTQKRNIGLNQLIAMVGAPGVYRGVGPKQRSCELEIESLIWEAPSAVGRYDPKLGVYVAKPAYNSRIRSFLIGISGGIDPSSSVSAPGESFSGLRAKLSVKNAHWTDTAELSVSSRKHGINTSLKDDRALSITEELLEKTVEGLAPSIRYRVRSAERSKANKKHFTRVSLRGTPAKRDRISWIEIARKDSPERLKDKPRLRSLQNQLLCRDLKRVRPN